MSVHLLQCGRCSMFSTPRGCAFVHAAAHVCAAVCVGCSVSARAGCASMCFVCPPSGNWHPAGGGRHGFPGHACTFQTCVRPLLQLHHAPPPAVAPCAPSCSCTTCPALRVTGININNGVRVRAWSRSCVRVQTCRRPRQCAVLASKRECAPLSLLPSPLSPGVRLTRYARLAAYPSASPPLPCIPCLSLSPPLPTSHPLGVDKEPPARHQPPNKASVQHKAYKPCAWRATAHARAL